MNDQATNLLSRIQDFLDQDQLIVKGYGYRKGVYSEIESVTLDVKQNPNMSIEITVTKGGQND